jgi:WD40 repeat protein
VIHLAWSPDGQNVATITEDGTIRIIDASTGKEMLRFGGGTAVGPIAYSPDGKTLAVLEGGAGIRLWNAGSGKQERSIDGNKSSSSAEHIAYATDGQTIIAVGVGALYLRGRLGSMSLAGLSFAGSAAIAPDGSASGWCGANGTCFVYQHDLNHRNLDPVSLQVGSANCMALGPGGKQLAVGNDDRDVRLWDLTTGKATTRLSGLEKPASKMAVSADGKTLAALAGDGTSVRVWDLTNNATRCQINHNRGSVRSLALSPDGKMLATTAVDGKLVFLWRTAARQLWPKGSPLEVSEQDLAKLWADLASNDHEVADRAWRTLGEAGDNSIGFLRDQIQKVTISAVDKKQIEKLVADLNSEKYSIREQATKLLLSAGDLAVPPLQRLLEQPPSEEARERAKLLLKKLGDPVLTPERQLVLDAIELLEQIGTARSIAVLEEIARDALIPRIRIEARQALQRIARLREEKN